jgi:anti-anti-sigma factor
MSLTIRTQRLQDVRVLCLAGSISYGRDIEALTGLITELLQEHAAVLLDLEEVTTIDTAGVGALVVLYRWAQAGQARVAFCCPPTRISELLQGLDLREILQLHQTREEAIEFLLASEAPAPSLSIG